MKFRFFEGAWQASLVSEEIIVFFDSECLLCQGALRWLNRMDSKDRLHFAPLGGETAQRWELLSEEDSMGIVLQGKLYRSSEAARLAFREAGGVGLLLAGLLKMIPLSLREWGYRWISKKRKSLVRKESCDLPEEGMREKLLD